MRIREPSPLRFRCHTGHAFTAESLVVALEESTEQALWNCVRLLQEAQALLTEMAQFATGDAAAQANYLRRAENAQTRADLVRKALVEPPFDPAEIGATLSRDPLTNFSSALRALRKLCSPARRESMTWPR